ncbi:hypothetical protein DSO57_1006025 [Entomophthora muscae]|uniref:Uncharacterized protein n=1 Tax=Entomophthora muscae TaxID=34485 RepID=A0ACC2T7N7_9FUNG|nr:hypothetical protein DSO57_1006025 [Entomophthora muscae]
MCNPFATEAKAKKETPALETLEACLKDITAKSEKVFLAQEQSGNCGACLSQFDGGYMTITVMNDISILVLKTQELIPSSQKADQTL